MKLGAVSLVYNEEPLVKGCIRSLKKYIDKHVMCVSTHPYYGEPQEQDRSDIIAEEEGAIVIPGQWPLDHMQRNTGIAYLGEEYDWIICTDVDMWLTEECLKNLMKELKNSTENAYVISQRAYWRDTSHVLADDYFMPVIAIRPHVRFVHIGNVDCSYKAITSCPIDHLNWCEPKDILKKVKTYSHAPEFNQPLVEQWYENTFLRWREGDKAVMPDGKEFNVRRHELPEELKRYL